jgi:hypothetical protein
MFQKPSRAVSKELTRDEKLIAAIAWLQDHPKFGIRPTAFKFAISEATLRGRLKGAKSRTEEMQSRRHISPVETKQIAEFAKLMQSLHFPLTPADIVHEAERIWYAHDDNARTQGKKLWPNWYRQVFLKDNPEMVNKLGKGYDRARATCASHAQLQEWYFQVRGQVHCFVYKC